MKKLICVTVAILLLLGITACESTNGTLGVSVNNTETEDGKQTQIETTEEAKEQEVSIQETVLLDEADVKITAKSLSTDGLFGQGIKLLIENNSEKNLTVQCRNASVNGYMVDTMLSADVVSGKKVNETLVFSNTDFEACGIETIADMEFSFHIFESDSWDTYFDSPEIQLKTSVADTYTYVYDDSGSPAYDENNVRIIIKGTTEDSILGPGITVYIENNGEQDITVQTRNVSINGFMVNAMFSSDVCAGKRAVDSITFLSSDLEENEIAQIETVELSFHIFDTSDWEDIADTDAVTITY